MAAQAEVGVALDRRFVFVTGKGGVGKTTVTAALAVALAATGRRVLVAMCGAHERLSSILGTAPIGHDTTSIRDGIWATKIDPERAMEEYGQMVIKVRAVTRIVFESGYTQALFRAIPGLYGWSMLGKAWYHSTERLADGSPRFDTVLFDAPSTGHGLEMLRIPQVIVAVAPPGVLRRDAEQAWQMLRDPAHSGVVVVSWPEELPVSETIELCEALRAELAMPVAQVIVNGALPRLFSSRERAALLGEAELQLPGGAPLSAGPGERALRAAARRAAREALQQRSLERLQRSVAFPLSTLPFLLDGAGTPQGAEQLARLLAEPGRSTRV